MPRLAPLLLAAIWVAAPGCWSLDARRGTPEIATPPTVASSPGGVAIVTLHECGRLRLDPSDVAFDVGGNVSFEVRFTNCGNEPIPIPGASCGHDALAPQVEGPASGFVANGTLGTYGASCGPLVPVGAQEPQVLPNQTQEWRGWWNGTIATPCVRNGTDPAFMAYVVACGTGPAPSGVYRALVTLATPDGAHTWEASATFLLRAWTERHGSWSEYHPEWRVVGENEVEATDHATFDYRTTLQGLAPSPDPCAPESPGNATWVRLSSSPCRWVEHPSSP